MNMKNTVLVTGATGNIGSRVVKELSKSHINIRAGVHSPDRIEPIKDSSAELVEIDFNRRETVPPALKGVEKLFILTPLVPNMVEIGIQLVEEAKKAGVRYIVRSSALGADTEPSITLGEWHGAIDKAVVESGIPYTILRPNSFMQNYSNMYARNLKTQSEFYLPLGDGKVSLVDTRDIAAVAAAILTKGGHDNKIYELTGPEAISNYRIAEIFSNVLGRSITYVDASDDDTRKGMKNAGVPDWFINAVMELYGIQKAGYGAVVTPVIEEITGEKPINFEQFVRDYSKIFS